MGAYDTYDIWNSDRLRRHVHLSARPHRPLKYLGYIIVVDDERARFAGVRPGSQSIASRVRGRSSSRGRFSGRGHSLNCDPGEFLTLLLKRMPLSSPVWNLENSPALFCPPDHLINNNHVREYPPRCFSSVRAGQPGNNRDECRRLFATLDTPEDIEELGGLRPEERLVKMYHHIGEVLDSTSSFSLRPSFHATLDEQKKQLQLSILESREGLDESYDEAVHVRDDLLSWKSREETFQRERGHHKPEAENLVR
ncbi:hypothetical protein CASFOL_028622 [Castilleja foliolosa]|uniref:Uncharacterized protein n=1 Tax=Castilleja foliolosa TaxID=1961234 RepID=A0ABD3CD63_9LAMI